MSTTPCVRTLLEEREHTLLRPFATRSSESRGRAIPEEEDAYRTVYQRDRDRILHTKAFRRLKRKTQVFLAPTGDHFRTRLTHTLEVAQISRTVARALFLNEDLTEAIALGHDLGHTPFGHAGESVLNEVYAPGFFHFEQSLRVVEKLEKRHSGRGLNLTWEVRDGILHHSRGKAVLQGRASEGPNTLEGGVVSVCDAIAYINHDIDDAIRAGVIGLDDLPQDALNVLGRGTSQRIDAMVVGLIQGTAEGKLGILPETLEAMNALRDFMYREVYPCEAIDREIRKAKRLLRELYFYLLEYPVDDILEGDPEDSLERRTVDFCAGMTDEFALQLYQNLFFPKPW
ncbi:MAG: deoxyguanosinetriphosphate triphosphohydrolase [Candidatus Hydrogenedentes bacterium]|nr:deoxyguanosinetriphosphate triphosphohydrolase [Candidatus Hydrogenedentota bacterium]